MSESSVARFAQLVQGPPDQVRLDEAALLIAAADHDVDVEAALAILDGLAAACGAPTLEALRRHLFVEEGFAGTRDDYYDPANSYLDLVLSRRVGIPITLSVVAIEVGRRLGLIIEGLNTPGHFLVRHEGVVFDPFERGRIVPDLVGADLPVAEPMVILARMLANLKHIQVTRSNVLGLRRVLQLRVSMPNASDADRAELRRLEAGLN
jgi:regulator of sirC expression with transglutaminase-like and TPR domain